MRLVQILSCVVASFGFIAGVAAQSVAVEVRYAANAADGCFEAGKLQERVAHYLGARATNADDLRFELYVDSQTSAELRVFRAQELVSRRRFDQLSR